MFNLNLKREIGKDGYNPLITVKINDSVTYTLEKETTTLKLVNREYKLTFSCPNVDNSGKLENTIIVNPTSDNLDITIVPSINGIQVKQHGNNIDNENTSGNFITKLWNNNIAMIAITAILFVFSFFVFSGDMLIGVVVSQSIGIFLGGVIGQSMTSLGKGVFLGGVIGFLLGIPFALLMGLGGSSGSSGNKCYRCDGAGMINKGFLDFVTCPACKGTGIPHI